MSAPDQRPKVALYAVLGASGTVALVALGYIWGAGAASASASVPVPSAVSSSVTRPRRHQELPHQLDGRGLRAVSADAALRRQQHPRTRSVVHASLLQGRCRRIERKGLRRLAAQVPACYIQSSDKYRNTHYSDLMDYWNDFPGDHNYVTTGNVSLGNDVGISVQCNLPAGETISG